jgi:outer membrane receptor protein involved in Fe transport
MFEKERSMRAMRWTMVATALALLPTWAQAQGSGQLTGTVTGPTGNPISGVTVVISEVSLAEITDQQGRFRLTGVPPGEYHVTFSLGDRVASVEGVVVRAGEATRLDHQVTWQVSFAETITVFSASRRRERVVEAPAAITVVSEEDIARESSHGQLPKVLEFTPGAEVTQSGLYDFNLNVRGFNSSLNRRVPTLVDGRDPSVAFLGAQDWPAQSSLGDVASLELVRGPSAALYGTNAFNGVLNLTTKQPRFSQGGTVSLTGGELSTLRGDVRWAGQVAHETYLKASGGYTQSDDFYQSRNVTPEYGVCAPGDTRFGCLRREAVPIARSDNELTVANLRLDRYFGESFLSLEGGYSSVEGPLFQTGIGRVQVLEADTSYSRINFSAPRFNALTYYNRRDAPRQLALASGANLFLDSEVWAAEIQGNQDFAGGKGRVVGGASYKDETIETRRTLTADNKVGGDRTGVYGQIDYAFMPKLKAVVAARWDDSSLHDSQFSPKVALVFSPTPNQTLRLTYNEAFQSPNYSEFFLAAPAGAPVNLAAAAAANPQAAPLAPALTALGFNFMPILARGNEALEVEEIETWELGYSGILGGKLFLTADYYRSELTNFVTDLLPGVNRAFAPYAFTLPLPPQVQAGVIGFLQAALGPNFVGVTNLPNGAPALIVSYANAGNAESQGIDLGINYYVTGNWTVNFNYSWFDFEVKDQLVGDEVLPMAPEHSVRGGISYVAPRWDLGISGRWVDGFDWAAGIFQGPIPSYTLFDLVANYRLTGNVRVGLNVSNLMDKEHYQTFGGDLMGRRALGTVTFNW